MEELIARLRQLQAVKDAVDAECAPLAAEREALWARIHPLKAEVDALAAREKEIKAGAGYWSLCKKIGVVADAIMALRKAR